MYLVNVQDHYDSAHALRRYKGGSEPLHGHRFRVEVGLETDEVGDDGIAFDFVEISEHLRAVVSRFEHRNLNEVPPFDVVEPSAENQARHIYDALKESLPQATATALAYVRVWETPAQWAQYSERRLPR